MSFFHKISFFVLVYRFPLEKSLEWYFWVKDMNLDMVLAIYPSMPLGVTVGTGKRCHPPTLILMGTGRYSSLMSLWKRHLHFVSSSVEWTVLAFPAHPNGSLLTPVILSVVLQNCKAHFHVGCLCLEALKKKISLLLMVGCLLCSSLLVRLSWKCTFSGRGPSWAA